MHPNDCHMRCVAIVEQCAFGNTHGTDCCSLLGARSHRNLPHFHICSFIYFHFDAFNVVRRIFSSQLRYVSRFLWSIHSNKTEKSNICSMLCKMAYAFISCDCVTNKQTRESAQSVPYSCHCCRSGLFEKQWKQGDNTRKMVHAYRRMTIIITIIHKNNRKRINRRIYLTMAYEMPNHTLCMRCTKKQCPIHSSLWSTHIRAMQVSAVMFGSSPEGSLYRNDHFDGALSFFTFGTTPFLWCVVKKYFIAWSTQN